MRQNFVAQSVQLLKCWLFDMQLGDMQLGAVMEKNQALSVNQYQLQVLQFWVHLIGFLSILLIRGSGFIGIQRAAADEMGSRPPHSDKGLLLVQVWLSVGLWSCFSVQPLGQLSYKIYFVSHGTVRLRNGSLMLYRIREDTTK